MNTRHRRIPAFTKLTLLLALGVAAYNIWWSKQP